MTITEWEALFPGDDACKAYLTRRRRPDGVVKCSRCGNDKVWELKGRPFHWQCNAYGPRDYRFSVLVGSVFENTNIRLRQWFKVIYLMLISKKGISSLQIQRIIGFGSYRTALYVTHRIRAAFTGPEFRKLIGIVEVGETYVGGKNKNRHADKKTDGRGGAGKVIVMCAVERGGNVVGPVVARTDIQQAEAFINEVVSEKVDLVATDESGLYARVGKKWKHASVNHMRGEYVRGNVHTCSIDGFWSLIKRGIIGTCHNVSRKYLLLFVAEFEWRLNNRDNADIFGASVATC